MSFKLRYLLIFFVSLGLHLLLLVIPLSPEHMTRSLKRYPVGTLVRRISSFAPVQRGDGQAVSKEDQFPVAAGVRKSAGDKPMNAPVPRQTGEESPPDHAGPVAPAASVSPLPRGGGDTDEVVAETQGRVAPLVGPLPATGASASRRAPQPSAIDAPVTRQNRASAAPKRAAVLVTQALPRYDENPRPRYPDVARRKGWSGIVEMRVRVDTAGRVEALSVEQSSGYSVLDRAARRAVRLWRFVPATRAGRKVVAEVLVPLEFRLPGNEGSRAPRLE